MYEWGLLDIESTLLKNNAIWHHIMNMNHILGFVSLVTPSIEWKP
jgi:hypothetical protein